MEEYRVEVIISDTKEEKSKTNTPYRTETASRAAYKARNLADIAKSNMGVTFVHKRLVRIGSDETEEELLESDAYRVKSDIAVIIMLYASGETPQVGDRISNKKCRIGIVIAIQTHRITVKWVSGVVGIDYAAADKFTLISRTPA